MKKIKITIGQFTCIATLKSTPTAHKIYNTLPFKSNISVWGDEIYCKVPVECVLEVDSKAEVEIGELGYWPVMPAFCIFYGPTPISHGEKPLAAGPVNVFGQLENIETESLRNLNDGDEIHVEAI